MKVYCKNCESFPRFRPYPKALARCKALNTKDDWHSSKWTRRFCDLKNRWNDCIDYEIKYP